MNHTITNQFTATAAKWIGLVTIGLFPLFMLPTTTNFFEPNKLALLVVATVLLLILWAADTIASKRVHLELIPFSLPILAYGIWHFASAFISTPQSPVDALMDRGTFFISFGLFVTLLGSMVDNRKFIRHALYTLIGSGTVLAIISLFQAVGFGFSTLLNFTGMNLPNTLAFTPAGSPVALLTFIVPVLLLSLILAFTKTDSAEKISLFILSALMASAVVVVSFYSFPGKETAPVFLPFRVGYMIAIETLKNPKTALVGVGTQSFTVAYNQFRPSLMNSSIYWNLRFGASSNELFQILTTVGVIGLGLFIWLIVTMVKAAKFSVKSAQAKTIKMIAFGLLLLFLLVPGTYLLFFTFFVLVMLWGLHLKFTADNMVKTVDYSIKPYSERPQTLPIIGVYGPAVLIIVASLAALYLAGKAYAAEAIFQQAMKAASQNDGVKTYNLERQAILQNPYLTRYRRAYATTNLALANSLAANKDLKDEDKQNIAQLIQQAIREAKVAATLEPQNATNWESLAVIYRSLINAAQGADQWTIAALSQAIQTDPMNPSLRIDLGGVYYSLGMYDQAIRLFQQAAELKADYANAFYNLSHAYEQKQDVVSAFDYMRQTLSLTKADSADYAKAKAELETLSTKLPKTEQKQGQEQAKQTAPAQTQLNAPSPAPSPAATINLPQGSGPETINP